MAHGQHRRCGVNDDGRKIGRLWLRVEPLATKPGDDDASEINAKDALITPS